MRTIRTTQTLKEVVRCLETHAVRSQYSIDLQVCAVRLPDENYLLTFCDKVHSIGYEQRKDNSRLLSYLTYGHKMRTLRDVCVGAFANKSEAEHEISRLFAVIDSSLQSHNCKLSVEKDAASDYRSGVWEYLFYGHILEVSIMKENNDSKAYYYYVVISFPEQVHLYEIVEIQNSWVPKFTSQNQVNDEVNIRTITGAIAKVFDTFCSQFVIKKKFPRREFSMLAIKPLFSVPKTPAKTIKRKKNAPSKTTSDMNKFQVKIHPIYDRLDKLFKAMEEKPNENARLFALIHDILVFFGSFKISTEKDSWPGGAAYDGFVYDLLFSETLIDETLPIQEQQIEWHAFKICLLSNGKEFYICIRFSANTAKKCIKKITKALVPSFVEADMEKENEKIHNLKTWLFSIIEHFIKKLVYGSYCSANPSFVSSIQESEDERN